MSITTPKPMTLQEFLTHDDGTEKRYELVDGVLVEMGVESTINSQIVMRLIFVFAGLGVPQQQIGIKQKLQVRGSYATAREPDLILHSVESIRAIKGRSEACLFLNEPNPLVLVEIVSPGSKSTENYQRDYIQKPLEYADRSILEFWQVDPDRNWIRVGTLKDGAYEFETFQGEDVIISPTFPTLQLTAADILAADKD